MQAPAIIIAETAARGTENLPFLVAMLGVILSLIALFRISMIKPRAEPHRSPTPPPPGARGIPPRAADIPPEIVAVIAAAVASMHHGRNLQIISIKPMSTSWERAGRQSVLTSHRIR
jgi:glutaconyl-CoA decarboxylase